MKKTIFLAVGLAIALSSCQKEQGISPDDSLNNLLDDKGSSGSSSASVNITLTEAQKATINAVIASKYAGYSIKEAQQELEHGLVVYQITIISGKTKKKLLFNSAWQFIGEKV